LGYRIQGVLVRANPDSAGLTALERAYGYRLFELVGRGLWLLDFAIAEPKPDDRATIRAARPLAAAYVDALRVLGHEDETFEQLAWLTAAAVAAKQLRQPVLGFLSDDDLLDFAAVVTPDGVSVIGDKLGQYLLRWEGGTLAIQPFCKDGTADEPPVPPEELSLIPAVELFPNETLASSGYPLHGNVTAEMHGFAEGASSLNIGSWTFGPAGSLKLVEAKGLDHSLWDRAAGEARARSR
jgi:hypothetical protein